MPSNTSKTSSTVGDPFPLKRYFYSRVIPVIVVFLVILSGLLWFAFAQVTRDIYQEQAMNRAELIVDSLKDAAPEAWEAFLAGNASEENLDVLGTVFTEETERQKLIRLKAYDLRGMVIFDMVPVTIGTIETSPSLREVIVSGEPAIIRKQAMDGTQAYEIYAPYLDESGNMRVIFEMYEEVSYLDRLLYQTAIPAIAVPLVLQVLLITVLGGLVVRAQKDIDRRTDAIAELSEKLKTFVSSSAIAAANSGGGMEKIPSRKITCTLFHSDVRDFTSYAENNSPERVVFFLNDLMTIQVKIIDHFGGDIDKMIGDALLVRFEGENAEKRAIDAAKAILDSVNRASLARGLGIGIFTGQVISGAVGPKSRRDFTVIGDSVNMSARLCSQANAGEIVADSVTVEAAEAKGFKEEETVEVKGRTEPLSVKRWQVSALSSRSKVSPTSKAS